MTAYYAPLSKQHGIVIPLVAIALLALLGVTGLAVDMGHLYENKTRLQNAVDAAALSAAKRLDDTRGDQAKARTAAQDTVVNWNASAQANQELSSIKNGDVIVEFSSDYWGLAPGACNVAGYASCFVRVSVNNLIRPNFLIQVLDGIGATKTIVARAVAGPTPVEPCDVFPVTACAKPPAPGEPTDLDDAVKDGDGFFYGYQTGQAACLKSPNAGGQPSTECEALGPGNFHLLDLADSHGGNDVCENLAGTHQRCMSSGDNLDLKQGYTNGPVQNGVNTRFNEYPNGGACGITRENAPPDKVVSFGPGAPGETYASWKSAAPEVADGIKGRRVVTVPIADCPTPCSGNSCKPPLLGFGCFFLRNKMENGKPGELIGEFTGTACLSKGKTVHNPGTGPGPYTIVLYKDPGSGDS